MVKLCKKIDPVRTSSDHLQLRTGSIINGRLTGIYNLGISVHAGRKVIIGLSKSSCTMESWCKLISSPHAETSTEVGVHDKWQQFVPIIPPVV